jgi:SAM-dependent methyltransferase
MAEVDLLRTLPKARRDVNARAEAKSAEVIAEASRFGQVYFDGPRAYGYGGYYYDGRWMSVARDIVEHFGLRPGMRVLDIGCAKGFLVRDLMAVCPSLDVYGLDVSHYAVMNAHADIIGRLHLGDCRALPFPDQSFDAVLAINVIHNLERPEVVGALREMMRISRSPEKSFVQVDAYSTDAEREQFEQWVLTAKYAGTPENWRSLFEEAGYQGDWAWTVITN